MMMIHGRLAVNGVGHITTPNQISRFDAHTYEGAGRIVIAVNEIAVAEAEEHTFARSSRRGETGQIDGLSPQGIARVDVETKDGVAVIAAAAE